MLQATRWGKITFTLLVLFGLAGCCTFRTCETLDTLELAATEYLNSCDGTGQHPVTVRIFGLAKTNSFTQASFDELWHGAQQALGPDYIYSIEKVILPGQTIVLEPVRKDGVTAIGFVANFCELTTDCWRRTVTMKDGSQKIRLHLNQTCMSVK